MIITGIVLGPFVLDLFSPQLLAISADLREIALIVILLRAGLSLDIKDLKKVGLPAILMCFVPATLEMLAITFLAPLIFDISRLDAMIMGAVVAAVSPAVVVPRMLSIMETSFGKDKSIPQLILASASVDDVFVIILFTTFMSMHGGGELSTLSLLFVPLSIVLGLLMGILVGLILVYLFKRLRMRDTVKVLIILAIAFLMVSLEDFLIEYISISSLLAVMAMGGTILKRYEVLATRIVAKFSKIWVGAQVLLFVLMGAAVNINYLGSATLPAILLLVGALTFRIIGVNISLIKSGLNGKEKLFCSIAYLPKATVQAAIGAIPLSVGVESGNLILTVAVLAIIITAPIGAVGIDNTYKKLLTKQGEKYGN